MREVEENKEKMDFIFYFFDNVVLILEIIRNQFVAFARFMSVWSASVLWSSFAYLARKLGKTQGKQA